MVKNKKRAARAGAVTLGATLLTMTASPALADVRRDDGDDPGPGLSLLETLTYFVGLPILLFVVIAGLVMMGEKSATDTGAEKAADSGSGRSRAGDTTEA